MISSSIDIPVAIVGAGPAGLAVGALLRRRGIEFAMLEKSEQVGHAWHHHYDRLHLHTVKELSHLPGLPFPEEYPRYVSREQFCRYLEAYARHFDLAPRFGQQVMEVTKTRDAWELHVAGQKTLRASGVVVATGVNRVPNRPSLPGEEQFEGQLLHSVDYRRAGPFLDQKILVVGMGNTGAEIALDLAEQGSVPSISVRGPVNIVPRDAFGRPTQLTARRLARLPNWLSDWLGKQVQRLTIGDLKKFGLGHPEKAPAQQLREEGKTPVIDLGTVGMIRRGRIKVRPAIRQLEARMVIFEDGTREPCDTIILSTGYRPCLDQLIPALEGTLDAFGCPDGWQGQGKQEGLYFIGFDNYTPGGILGTINRDAPLITNAIARQMAAGMPLAEKESKL